MKDVIGEIKIDVQLLKATTGNFTNDRKEEIKYTIAEMITSQGQIIKASVYKDLVSSLEGLQNVEGTATLSIAVDRNYKPTTVRLTKFDK